MILLTGFEPFGGDTANPSWAAARSAARLLQSEGLDVQAVELPCVFGESAKVLAEALERFTPELVLCAGQAGGRARISLERVAINCDDARIPDNAGNQPVDEPVVPGGPAAYFTSLPVKAALAALTRRADPGRSVPECRDLCLQPCLLRAHARPAATSGHQGRLCPRPLRGHAASGREQCPLAAGRPDGGGARRRRAHCAGDDGGSQAPCRRNPLAPAGHPAPEPVAAAVGDAKQLLPQLLDNQSSSSQTTPMVAVTPDSPASTVSEATATSRCIFATGIGAWKPVCWVRDRTLPSPVPARAA